MPTEFQVAQCFGVPGVVHQKFKQEKETGIKKLQPHLYARWDFAAAVIMITLYSVQYGKGLSESTINKYLLSSKIVFLR